MNRSFTIDLVRLIAAFCIMTVHTHLPGFGYEIDSIIRICGRWAVPFFFITTGYFLGKKIAKCDNQLNFLNIEKNLINLISIFIISSSVYLMHSFLFSFTPLSNDVSFLLNGAVFHLWFIGSMIFGYMFLWYIYSINMKRFLPVIAFIIIGIAVFSDSYDLLFNKKINYDQLPRFLISIPFMYIGILLSNKTMNKNKVLIGIFIFFIGFTMQFVEMYFLYKKYHYPMREHQMLIGTVISSIAIFILCLSVNIKDNIFSRYGRKYSLFIYLYHLLGYWILGRILRWFDLFESDYCKILIPVLGFIFMIIISVALDRFLPCIFSIFNGELKLTFLAKNR